MAEVVLNVDFVVAGEGNESPVKLNRVGTKDGQDITQRFIQYCVSQSLPIDKMGALGHAAGEFAKAHDSLLA